MSLFEEPEEAIAQFLEARIAEDESLAIAAIGHAEKTPPCVAGRWEGTTMETIAGCAVYDEQWLLLSGNHYDHDQPMSNKAGATGPGYLDIDSVMLHIAHWDPSRVLAECKAKRAIVEDVRKSMWVYDQGHQTPYATGELGAYTTVLRALAAAYADHPDFNPSWVAHSAVNPE